MTEYELLIKLLREGVCEIGNVHLRKILQKNMRYKHVCVEFI